MDTRTLPLEEMQGFPLSPQQRHLWRLLRDDVDPAAFRCACVVRIEGDLDPAALARAVRRTAGRHEILRTTFRRLEGMTVPLQVIGGGAGTELALDLDDDGEGATVEALLDEARRRPLGPEHGPLWAARLAALPAGGRALVLLVHALCGDAVSLGNLVREIAAACGASIAGAEPAGELLQYADLAEWQNALFEEGRDRPERSFWLSQDLSALDAGLPFERPAGAAAPFAPERVPCAIAPDLAARIAAWCESRGCPERLFLLTAWCALLARWTGRRELIVGVAHDGRSYEELAAPLGLFARFLPLACRIDGAARFQDQIDVLGALDRELADWQESFSWESLPEGGPAYAPFCFELLEEAPEARAGEVVFTVERHTSCVDRFGIKLVCERGREGLRAELHHDAGRSAGEEVARLAGSLRALLESAVRRPESAVEELEIAGPEERRRLLGRCEPAAPEPGGSVHGAFERQAARRGGEPAVVCGSESRTYAELNLRANRLARHLRELGAGPESRVAICLERSVEMVESILAVLKAGACYVPLDASLPPGRLQHLLADSGARVLLTRGGVADDAAAGFAGRVALVDDPAIARHGGENLPAGAGRLAYVMYTSGSTGAPKGVAVEHASLLHYVGGMLRRLGAVEGTCWATVSTFAADLGNTSIFTALCGGGCLHVIPQDCVADPGRLRETLARSPIDGLKIVPGHLSALLGSSDPGPLLPRRWLVLGGEACSWELVERVRRAAPGCRVLNHYGPTETTVGVLTCEVGEERRPGAATVPLGRPLPGSRAYVLDAGFKVVPPWVAGEVHLGGGGVARGYLGRPDLTAERFVPDPFGGEPGGRLYRTGDLARCLPDGVLEFLGRADDQVKIRGFRVEPGEIEATLRQGPGVREAAVVVGEGAAGDRRLMAYVVPSAGAPDLAVLRSWLSERLPSYMVPAAWVSLAALPRTANGKLHRAALPPPREPAKAGSVAPRTPVEEMVATLWSGLLGRDGVGAGDDFFALGGHSLLATQLLARLRETFGVEVPLRALFDDPTVAGLACAVEEARRAGGPPSMPPLEPAPRDRDLPLSFAQQRLWFLDQMEPGASFFNIPAPVRLAGRLDVTALENALTGIVRRHEVLRTAFPGANGRPVQVIAPPGPVRLPVIDLRHVAAPDRRREAERLVREEAQRPFDLARGPLLRVALLRLEADEHVLVLVMHHIASDAWSMSLFVQEAVTLYQAFTAGAVSPLPELPVQYADFAFWQRQWLQGEVLEDHLRAWRRQLAGAPAVFELPLDRPRPAAQTSWGVRLPLRFSDALSRDLKELSRRERVTLFMTLVAAFDVLLRHATGRDDVVVGTNVANRTASATEGLIGFFINQLVIRIPLDGSLTFRELLGRVRSVMLEAYAHQDLPFEKLVEELQPERRRSRSLLFQIKIELQNRPPLDLQLPGLAVSPFELATEIVRYDLHLLLVDEGERIAGTLQYDPDLFDHTRIVRMSEQLEALLLAVVREPGATLDDLQRPLAEMEERELSRLEGQLEEAGVQKLKRARRQAVAA